jgi:hypothetical protein
MVSDAMEVTSTSSMGYIVEDLHGNTSIRTRLPICIRMISTKTIANTWELWEITLLRVIMLVVAGGRPDTCGIIAIVDCGETRHWR